MPPSFLFFDNTASVVDSLRSMHTLGENTPGEAFQRMSLGGISTAEWCCQPNDPSSEIKNFQTLEGYLDIDHPQHLLLTFNLEG